MNSNTSVFLNISRWLSAFFVVFEHARHLVLVDLKNVEDNSIFIKIIYFLSGLGHESVVIFFVISGYLVGGLTLEKWLKHGPNLLTYSIARVSRIYTVLIPALIAGISIDSLGLYFFNLSEIYTNSNHYQIGSLSYLISSSMDATTFAGNLLLLQGISTGFLGSNGPLWSLSFEWWYYCIFGLVGASVTSSWRFRFLYAFAALALAYWLPEKLVTWGLIWLLGVFAYFWINSEWPCPNPVIGIFIFAIALSISRISHNVDNVGSPESIYRDFGLGLAYVFFLASASRIKIKIPFQRLHNSLANFSYSTYIFHFPALIFCIAFCYQVLGLKFRQQPDALGLIYMLSVIIFIYSYCYLWFAIAERHTNDVRGYLKSLISSKNESKIKTAT